MKLYTGIATAVALLLLTTGCAQNRYKRATAEDYYKDAQKALSKKKCFDASRLFRNLLSEYPGSYLVDKAQYGLGQSAFCDKDYVTAAFEFERLLNEFPTSPLADDARYQIGMCYYRQSRGIQKDQDETGKAIREFTRFVEDFPNSERTPDAQDRIQELRSKLAAKDLYIARNYLRWKYYSSAERYAELLIREHADAKEVPWAKLVLAQAKRMQGKLDEAMEVLTDLQSSDLDDGLREELVEESEKLRQALQKRPPQALAKEGESDAEASEDDSK